MSEADTRAQVAAIALTWEGTRYVNEARIKGVACDCTFVASVYEEAGVIPHFEIGSYSPQWHLHQREERYLNTVLRFAREIEGPPQVGDLVLFKFGRVFSHSGIVIGWPTVVHAGFAERMVVRADASRGPLAERAQKFFSLWPRF